MKKLILSISAALFLMTGSVAAQDLSQSQVPSVILNDFKKAFPKATDIEWEMDGDLYNVEFETGLTTDHEIWYNAEGKRTKHKEEISKKDLPDAVISKIKDNFAGYRLSDINKITTPSEVIYTLEVKSSSEEWELSVDSTGKILKQRAD